MVYRGKVQNGVVVLDKGVKLEEGEAVSVRRLRRPTVRRAAKKPPPTTFYERYRDLIGSVKGMPSDLASQHDHYLYGTPKKK